MVLLHHHTVARPGDRALAVRNIIRIGSGPAVDGFRNRPPGGIKGAGHGIDRGAAHRFHAAGLPVEFIVGVGDHITGGSVGVELFHRHHTAVLHLGHELAAVGIEHGSGHAAVAVAFQFVVVIHVFTVTMYM